MTEDDARAATHAIVGEAAFARLERFANLVRSEAERQNLVARATLESLWRRHMLDSAQLIPLAAGNEGSWIDVGTGAGFPGMVAALAMDRPFVLVEPRRMRAQFLQQVIESEALTARITVKQTKVERLDHTSASVISARAVASLEDLFNGTAKIATASTLYLLPKGQSATTELNHARERFEGMFHVEQSITDPSAGIIVASRVRARR